MALERSVVRPTAALDRRPPEAAAVPPVRANATAATTSLQQRLGAPAVHALAGAAARTPVTPPLTGVAAKVDVAISRSASQPTAPLDTAMRAATPAPAETAQAGKDATASVTDVATASGPPTSLATSGAAGTARVAAPDETESVAALAAGAGTTAAPAAASGAGAPTEAQRTAAAGKEGGPKGEAVEPSPRAAIAPAAVAVRQRAAKARSLPPASKPVGSAQAAAVVPTTEQKRGAARQTVNNLADARAEAVRRAEFKNKLKQAIDAATPKPKNESEAERVMKTGGAQASATLRGQLATERDAAAGPMKAAAETEVQPGALPAPPKTDLETVAVGPAPAPVSAAPVVPAPLPPERLDYSEDRAPTDRAMAENDVTKEQLQKGNDPAFGPTLEARQTAEQHEAQAEGKYRQQEAQVQGHALGDAHATLGKDLGSMHGERAGKLATVAVRQTATMAKNAAARQRITDTITGIKERTRSDVDSILKAMEEGAATRFEAGLKRAEDAYENTFEEEKGGVGTWLTTWGSDWEELIESSLAKARVEYLHQVDIAIDEVADFVEGKLAEAKLRVTAGKQEVETFVAGLDAGVQQFGTEALEAVSADFDTMTSDIEQRGDALVDKLAQQYKASYERMEAKEEALREANKSLWQRVYDATVGLIKKIIAFKDLLLGILAKAAGVIRDIISDPIGFLGNLIEGVMLGLKNFMSNISAHLKKGLMEWLFGALAGAGLQMPDAFDLKGIVSIVLQVLGLTYANFRARAVAIVGEPVVAALEKAAEVFKIVATEGVGGLWRLIKEKVEDLKSMVLDAIFDFIKERVIIAGVTWVIGLLNPASAFFKACKAIYDIVMFFVNRGSQILALVNAVIDSIAAIVKGSIGVAAGMVENALAKAIPVTIGFLASLLGLGDISGTIRKTIEKAQAPVNKAIDWVINGAVKVVKAAGKLVSGLMGGKDNDKKTDHEDDPEKAAKIEAALAAIHREEKAVADGDELSREHAQTVVKNVRRNHPVLKTLRVVPKADTWEYEYSASASRRETSALHRQFDREQVFLLIQDIARARFGRALESVEAQRAQTGESPLAIKPGDAPERLGAQIRTRTAPPAQGGTVELGVGSATVFAKQGRGVENVVIAGLGKYPEITEKLHRQGFNGPAIHGAVMSALRTGTGHPDILRLIALLFGAETSRLAIATVTGPLALGSLGGGASSGEVFGEGEKPGTYPEAADRAKSAAGRAEAIAAGEEFRPKTKIQGRGEEYLKRVVELVYAALKGEKIRDTDQLRARILQLLERFEKEAGVTK